MIFGFYLSNSIGLANGIHGPSRWLKTVFVRSIKKNLFKNMHNNQIHAWTVHYTVWCWTCQIKPQFQTITKIFRWFALIYS